VSRIAKTPTVLQMETVECGAAALGILLGYHGRVVPLAELRAECGVSRDGSNAANLVHAARRYGLKAKGLSVDLDDLRELTPPFIVFWNFNHFLVVEGFRKDRVRLNDPAGGRRSDSLQQFDESFTGVVLCMEPGPEFRRGGRAPSATRALWTRLRESGRDLLFCIVAGFLLVAPGLAAPIMTQVFVDEVLVADRRDWLRPLLLGMALLGALQAILRLLQLRYLRSLRTRLAIRLSGSFLWHVLRLPVGFFSQRYAGEISSRLALNHQIAELLSGQLAAVVIDCVMLVLYAAVMLMYDVRLTLIGVLFTAGNFVLLRWISYRRMDASARYRQELGKVSGVSIAGLQSIETLKASALESSFFGRWAGYYTKAALAGQSLERTNQSMGIVPPLLAATASLLVMVVGGWQVIAGDGTFTIGMLIAFQGLMASFQGPVSTLVQLGSRLQTLHGDLLRVDDVMLHPLDPETTADAERVAATDEGGRLAGRVELRGVTFGYSRSAPPLLESLDLVIEPGQLVALVGGSGSGKSTISKLVCGLYEPWSGEILIDGKPRNQLARRQLASSLSLVDQEILFFAGTVRENLTLWDSSVPQSQLEAACRDAEIHDVVLSLAGGYHAELLEGAANLSGGQRQRLEIARALVHNPSIVVMDEATSALDAATEHRIQHNLRRRGCSMLTVAHRLSTVRDAHEILVLSNGHVVQRGIHAELWQQQGEYQRLVRSEG
jgi:ATP-binding cassette subfamily C protein